MELKFVKDTDIIKASVELDTVYKMLLTSVNGKVGLLKEELPIFFKIKEQIELEADSMLCK